MNNGREKPTSGEPSRHHSRRRFWHRVQRWWSTSWIVDRWWRFDNWFFNWWHPPSGSESPGHGEYGRSRANRLTRAWRRLQRRIKASGPLNRLSVRLWRLRDWWYPPAKDGYPTARHYGRGRRSRFALAWRWVTQRLNQSAFGRGVVALYARFCDWWYPPAKDSHPTAGHYGRGRRSRLVLARRRVVQRVRQSAFGRRVAEVYARAYEWWYPVLDGSYTSHGYYGRRRKSRPVVAWRRFERWVRHSWLGQRCRQCLFRFSEWWYPPFQASDAYHPQYGYGQVSRPVLAFRRWNRWLRKTWVGREFGWILDEAISLFSFAQGELAQALSRRGIQRFLSRKLNIAALAVLALLAVAGYKYGTPYFRHYVEQRYARQAERFMLKGDFARACLRARQVLAINPDNGVACRVNAELADWANSPLALYWRQRAVFLAPTATNRLALAATALRAEPPPCLTAANTLDEIAPELQFNADYHLVAGALATKLDHLGDAEQHYALALKLQPDNPVTRMSLAVVQLQSRDTSLVADARATLELLNADGKLGILPLRSLVAESAAAHDFARAECLSSQLLTNGQATFDDRMFHLSLLHDAGRTNFRDFLRDTQQRAMQQPLYIGELTAWLNQSGFASNALAWLQEMPHQVSSRGFLPLAQADAYVALGKWKDLETYLEAEHWVGQDHVRIAMLALALRKEASKQGSALAWDRAVRLASDAPTALGVLAQLALDWGWLPEAEQVLWRAASKVPNQPWPLTSLQDLYIAHRDTAGLRRVYQALMQRDPNDELARNNFAMLSLLSGKDLPTAHEYAAELFARKPANPVFASTYAFSLHLQGKTKEGVEVLRALKPDDLANPAVAVYYGVMLSAAGEAQASKDYLDKSNKAFLLPEELALVTSARKVN